MAGACLYFQAPPVFTLVQAHALLSGNSGLFLSFGEPMLGCVLTLLSHVIRATSLHCSPASRVRALWCVRGRRVAVCKADGTQVSMNGCQEAKDGPPAYKKWLAAVAS